MCRSKSIIRAQRFRCQCKLGTCGIWVPITLDAFSVAPMLHSTEQGLIGCPVHSSGSCGVSMYSQMCKLNWLPIKINSLPIQCCHFGLGLITLPTALQAQGQQALNGERWNNLLALSIYGCVCRGAFQVVGDVVNFETVAHCDLEAPRGTG